MVGKGLSERRALGIVRMSASAFRYAPQPDRNVELRDQIVALAQRHRRYGVDRISSMLPDGFHWNPDTSKAAVLTRCSAAT